LQHQIAEQKRIDATTAGTPAILAEMAPDMVSATKDSGVLSEIQLLLPDPKKRGKQTKQIFMDKGMLFVQSSRLIF
jgi:translation initiation factor 2-alpha kinase 4